MTANGRPTDGGRARITVPARHIAAGFAPHSGKGHVAQLEVRCRWLEERLRQLLDTSATAMVATDNEETVVDWNAEAERLFGWRRHEVVGRPLFDTILAAPLPAEERARLDSLGPGNGVVSGQHLRAIGRRRNGDVFLLGLDVWATALGESNTLNALAYPMSEEEPTSSDRCQMGSLIDSTGEAIIGTDLERVVFSWNPAAEGTFGYTAAEMEGTPLAILFPPECYQELAVALGQLVPGAPVEHDTTALHRSGSIVEVALTLSMVGTASGTSGFSIVARDVTEERRMQAELNDTVRCLEAALNQARQSEARERGLVADVAHQLRSPIAGIRAAADTLLRGVSDSTHDQLLAGMVRETSRAARLLTALLQMARLDDGHQVTRGPCDLVALCEDEAARVAALSPELTLRVVPDASLVSPLHLDAAALREILSNLLDNARRHAKSRIEVAIRDGGGWIEVRVADDGPGLPLDMAEQAFERFVSLDGRGGSGLGLPIAQGLARAHSGDLTYDGTAFVLRLDLDGDRSKD